MYPGTSPAAKLMSAWDWSKQFSEEELTLFNNPLYLTRMQLKRFMSKVTPGSNRSLYRMNLGDRDDSVDLSEDSDGVLRPGIHVSCLKFWSYCYLRWLTPVEIIGGGTPSVYIQQCILVEEIICLQHKIDSLEKSTQFVKSRRPKSDLFFSFECNPSVNARKWSKFLTSSFPFVPDTQRNSGSPLSLYMERSNLCESDDSLDELSEDETSQTPDRIQNHADQVTPSDTGHADRSTPSDRGHADRSTPSDRGHADRVTPSDRGHADRSTPSDRGHADRSTPSDRGHADRSTPSDRGHADRSTPSDRGHADRVTPSDRGHADRSTPSDRGHADRSTPSDRGHADRVTQSDRGHADRSTPSDRGHADRSTPSDRGHADRSTPSDRGHADRSTPSDRGYADRSTLSDRGHADRSTPSYRGYADKSASSDGRRHLANDIRGKDTGHVLQDTASPRTPQTTSSSSTKHLPDPRLLPRHSPYKVSDGHIVYADTSPDTSPKHTPAQKASVDATRTRVNTTPLADVGHMTNVERSAGSGHGERKESVDHLFTYFGWKS
ncbi:hypothetical protein NP493_427g01035 [Ridgeia piscesae]|uniref:Myotubularin phosphatase domain-containing protein n=1 Tax=Ridgeia piscesae TaxID=27915 RepID=A0AAD9L1B2_RIDPI|nr:hypothetical protein NP493_427g01035 [Ridgeia piscesae]